MNNIIMLSWDSVRADHMPFHGYDRWTAPKLNDLARESLVFDDTFVSGVGTPTSFTGIFTGRHAHGSQVCIEPNHWKQANNDRRFLQEALQDNGYYTGAVHANPLVGRRYGWNRGWDTFKDDRWTAGAESGVASSWHEFKKSKLLPTLKKVGLAGHAIHAKNLVLGQRVYEPWEHLWSDIEDFILNAPNPWFLWILLVDTHHPWSAPDDYHRWSQPGRRGMHLRNYIMRRWPSIMGVQNQTIVNAYDNELRHADACLNMLMELLDEIGEDPYIVFHSDHGDELGEHRAYGHAPAMWDTLTHVPLVIHADSKSGRIQGPHSLLSLGSTILDLAGSDERLNSQLSYFDDEYEPDTVYIENREMDGTKQAAVTDGEWKVLHHQNGVQAYNRRDDRFEQTSRIADAPNRLLDMLGKHVNDRHEAVKADDDLEPETIERLEELGYL